MERIRLVLNQAKAWGCELRERPLVVLYLVFGAYFLAIIGQAVILRPDGLWAVHENVWADWGLHISIAQTFSTKSPGDWFAYHPFFSQGKFTYPFLTNLLPGLLNRAGVPIATAMSFSSVLYSLVMLGGLYRVALLLLRARWQAFLAVTLFLLSSGPGLLRLIGFLWNDFSWNALFYAPKDFTRIDAKQWYGGNVISALLIPQRGYLLGVTLGSWAAFLFLRGLEIIEAGGDFWRRAVRRRWFAAGLILGILPIAHMHTLFALGPPLALAGLARKKYWRFLPWFLVPLGALAAFFYFRFVHGGIQIPNFMRFKPGWQADSGLLSWIWLWLQLWGIALPAALVAIGFFWKQERGQPIFRRLVPLGFLLSFTVGNLMLFQPVAWDNSKVFFWCYFAFSVVLSRLVVTTWRWSRVLAAFLFFCLTATGIYELYRLARVDQHRWMITNAEDIKMGEFIRANSGPRDVFLTASDHNHPVMIWGVRPIVMGFTGWIANFGFDHGEAEKDIRTMYEAPRESAALFEKYRVKYVYLSRSEHYNFKKLDETYFKCRFATFYTRPNLAIYDRSRPLGSAESELCETQAAKLKSTK